MPTCDGSPGLLAVLLVRDMLGRVVRRELGRLPSQTFVSSLRTLRIER